MNLTGLELTLVKTREIFKVQVSLNVASRVLIYNKDRDHGIEVDGLRAEKIIQRFGLHKFGKYKTYVYGTFKPNDKTIHIEAQGELPVALTPDW